MSAQKEEDVGPSMAIKSPKDGEFTGSSSGVEVACRIRHSAQSSQETLVPERGLVGRKGRPCQPDPYGVRP